MLPSCFVSSKQVVVPIGVDRWVFQSVVVIVIAVVVVFLLLLRLTDVCAPYDAIDVDVDEGWRSEQVGTDRQRVEAARRLAVVMVL